jgi:hypothetical protein
VFNPFAGGKPMAPQLDAFARAVEGAHSLGVHQGATWGFAAGLVLGCVLTLWIIHVRARQS